MDGCAHRRKLAEHFLSVIVSGIQQSSRCFMVGPEGIGSTETPDFR
jgi:hypothetical protein